VHLVLRQKISRPNRPPQINKYGYDDVKLNTEQASNCIFNISRTTAQNEAAFTRQ